MDLPSGSLWTFDIAIEYDPFNSLIYLFDMVIFFRYVYLPKENLPVFLVF